jgi:hypothetical protein
MSESLRNLESAVSAVLAREPTPTPERIRQLIGQLLPIETFRVDDVAAERLAREFEERHGVTMEIGTVLTERGYTPWLGSARAGIDPYYWNRYRKLLIEKHFSGQVIATVDDVTDRILGLLENPHKDGAWDRRGMVVGHVQSGKTANYTGLICKAADAGYKLVVVIAGIHNNLRSQTQVRIDEGFVGRDSAQMLSKKEDRFVGVGRFDRTRRPVTFTTSVRDFSKGVATGVGVPLQNLNEPAVFVIKKNSSTLRNLLEWLREHSAKGGGRTVDAPMLLIDDEADNASINTLHGRGEVSRINGQIRDLLKMFERSCYVGYTATPFANIFIDPDSDHEMRGTDLFPKDFIVSLDPPTNYFGATRVFLDDPQAIIRHIDDNAPYLPVSHRKDFALAALPPSLMDAVRTFVVARSIRIARGQGREHSSMLVNASRFTDVHGRLRSEIHARLDGIQASTRLYGALPPDSARRDPEIAALEETWAREYSTLEVGWPEVLRHLHDAASPIRVVEVNIRSSGALNYADHEQTGLSVIAVGGLSLSRGLTLEGLMVSYFLRNSVMYDTLMQMGRWFGYRPGYDDLVRVWMPEEAEGWYAHIAESIELLRDELRRMEAVRATPEEFGLRVRSHPDTLMVTARNKMGTSERIVVSVGLGNSFLETATLLRDRETLDANRRAAVRFADQLAALGHPPASAQPVEGSGGWLLRGVPVEPILDFLAEFRNHPGAMLTDTGPVRRYIEDRRDDELATWDVLFAGTRGGKNGVDRSLGIEINCQRRAAGERSTGDTLYITNKQRVASRGVEKVGLSVEEILTAEQTYWDDPVNRGSVRSQGKSLNYPDRIYRIVRKRPLLVLHLLKIGAEAADLDDAEPVVAWSLSFPATSTPEKRVEYVINAVWMRENMAGEADDDEAEADDD